MTTSDAELTAATRRVLEEFLAAVARWDEATMRRLVADDAELHQPPTLPYGGVYRGIDAMMDVWKTWVLPTADPGTGFRDALIVEGGHAVVIMGSDKRGQRTTVSEDYVVEDGRIRRIRVFWFDPRPVAEAAEAVARERDPSA